MHPDPTRNVVVFQLDRAEGPATADAPTLAEDGVRRAWETVRHQHHVRPDEVTAMYCEWQPSEADARFIAENFPAAAVSYSFARPAPGGWDEAIEAARQAMEQAMIDRQGEQLVQAVDEGGVLLPLLWSASSPQSELIDLLPHRRLVPGRLYVAAAWVAPTPHGTIGMSHLTYTVQQELDNMSINDILDIAFDNLHEGLKIEGHSSELGHLATIHRSGSVAAAAIAIPDFHQRLSAIVEDDRLLIGIADQCHLQVTGASSGWADELRRTILAAPPPPAGEVLPTVLLMNPTGIHLLAEHP